MTQTGTQRTTNKCSQCGLIFVSAEELREHDAKCTADIVSPSKAASSTAEEVKTDMLIEDRFQATDH